MLEARLRRNHRLAKDLKLSVQQVLDCSFYNQGCDGGYSFLVAKFANEHHLVDNSAYQSGDKKQCLAKGKNG
jgi:cathepsin C